jgi:hypothetical protein
VEAAVAALEATPEGDVPRPRLHEQYNSVLVNRCVCSWTRTRAPSLATR